MSATHRRTWFVAAVAVAAISALSYLWYDYRFPSWKEEVRLPDGRTIVVRQKRDFIESYGTRKTWLTFSLPEMGGERTWVEHMKPILLTVTDKGEVFVVGWPSGFKQSSMYLLPKYGYVAYRWDGASFQRVPFLSVPESLRQEENLVRCMQHSTYLSWQTKQSFGCDEDDKYVEAASRRIDLQRMQAWAIRNARYSNAKPQSE